MSIRVNWGWTIILTVALFLFLSVTVFGQNSQPDQTGASQTNPSNSEVYKGQSSATQKYPGQSDQTSGQSTQQGNNPSNSSTTTTEEQNGKANRPSATATPDNQVGNPGAAAMQRHKAKKARHHKKSRIWTEQNPAQPAQEKGPALNQQPSSAKHEARQPAA